MGEDSDHETSQVIVDLSANTVYENRLRVRGREGGNYRCNVSNDFGNGTQASTRRFISSKYEWNITTFTIVIELMLKSRPLLFVIAVDLI